MSKHEVPTSVLLWAVRFCMSSPHQQWDGVRLVRRYLTEIDNGYKEVLRRYITEWLESLPQDTPPLVTKEWNTILEELQSSNLSQKGETK